ncbi:MAG: pantoate--beta-alanine ligase, partial [Bacillota bacterium]
IVREPDGLAMSSRNVYLSPEDRKDATVLYRSLLMARDLINQGERNPSQVKNAMTEMINQVKGAQIDYIEIYNAADLGELVEIKGQVLIALAVRFGSTRLIDNLLLEV